MRGDAAVLDGAAVRRGEPQLLEPDVAGVHLGSGPAGGEQLGVQRGEERVDPQVASPLVDQRLEERDGLALQQHATDSQPCAVGDQPDRLVHPDDPAHVRLPLRGMLVGNLPTGR